MLTRADVERRWGSANIIRLTPEGLTGVNLPASTKAFLSDVGVPREADLLVIFEPEALCPLPEYARATGVWNDHCLERYLRIGTDFGTELCVDTEAGGAVRSVDLRGP